MHHHDLVQSANLARGQNEQSLLAYHLPQQWSDLELWPPAGWWPEPARDLTVPGAGGASATFVLAPRADSVHAARSYAGGTLSGWGLAGLADSMELVVSELATNALRHGLSLDTPHPAAHQPVRMSLVRRGHLVAVAVADPGPSVPVMRAAEPFEPGGLGLHIVDSVSLCWGWSPLTPRGKAVWAVLSG